MSDSRPRLLVTGATGYLGAAIARSARDSGLDVLGIGRKLPARSDFECERMDVRDEVAVEKVVSGTDIVIHAAALAHVFRPSNVPRSAFLDVNTRGTENVARAAARSGRCRHFVLISTVAVYGGGEAGPLAEDARCTPISDYGESKLLAERAAREILAASGVRLTVLRMTTLYGEGNPGNVYRLMRAIDRGRFVWIGAGAQQKSLIHRDDAARACLLAALSEHTRDERTFNVTAPPVTMRDIVGGLYAALGRREPRFKVPQAWAVGACRAAVAISGPNGLAGAVQSTVKTWLADAVIDGGCFERELQFRPEVSLDAGLRRQVDWYRAGGEPRYS
jgi:nucleoside-diphosphate-sugar epimerase